MVLIRRCDRHPSAAFETVGFELIGGGLGFLRDSVSDLLAAVMDLCIQG